MSLRKNILITGPPGVGKTTMIKKLAERLSGFGPAGFYTAELREKGLRRGFELIGLDGSRGLLSHMDAKGPRVGKYGVDLVGFEDFLDALDLSYSGGLIVIDEIGKMECLSNKFKKLVRDLLGSERPVIATIALRGERFIEVLKTREDVVIFEINERNREAEFGEILKKAEALIRRG